MNEVFNNTETVLMLLSNTAAVIFFLWLLQSFRQRKQVKPFFYRLPK